jgi:hypothetical protein
MATIAAAVAGAYDPSQPYPSPGIEDIESFPRIYTGVENTKRMDANPQITNTQTKSEDPFSSQRKPMSPVPLKEAVAGTNSATRSKDLPIGSPPKDRKLSSDEWGRLCYCYSCRAFPYPQKILLLHLISTMFCKCSSFTGCSYLYTTYVAEGDTHSTLFLLLGIQILLQHFIYLN